MHESNPIYVAKLNSHVDHPTMNGITLKSYHEIINAIKLCAPIGTLVR